MFHYFFVASSKMVATDDSSSADFFAVYNAKDLILYALSIGFGSSEAETDQDRDLRFLYEQHPRFEAVPTFCLILLFWARLSVDGTSHGLPSFPPEVMASVGVLPTKFLRAEIPVSTVLHTWQSIRWHRQLPVPQVGGNKGVDPFYDSSIRTILRNKVLSVVPKSSTFVTSETTISLPRENTHPEQLLCTLQSTTLVVGIPTEQVIPYMADSFRPPSKRQIPKGQKVIFQWNYKTLPTQALLYRLASGDTNHIHVDPVSKTLGMPSSKALLHGLCTLGIVARAIFESYHGEYTFSYLESRFTKPVVGDELFYIGVKYRDKSSTGRSQV